MSRKRAPFSLAEVIHRASDIGKPLREIEVQPVRIPDPIRVPETPSPEPTPAPVTPEREPVPA